MTLARAFPSDADSVSGSAYNIMRASRSVVTRYPLIIDSRGTGKVLWGTRGCESETEVYLDALVQGPSLLWGHDNGLDGTSQSGVQYSVMDDLGPFINGGSFGGISFYGEGLASRSLCLRSGLASACTAADKMNNYWSSSPFGNPEVYGGSPLFVGGQAIAGMIDAIIYNEAGVSWPTIRTYARAGEVAINCMSGGTCGYDSRDGGYQFAWLVLGAVFDPDTTTATTLQNGTPVTGYRARWQADLATLITLEGTLRKSDHSWSNRDGTYGIVGPDLTTTNGSAIVTTTSGGTIPTQLCSGTGATGTGTVTAGSATLTITSGTVPAGDGNSTILVINRCDSGTCPPTAEPSTTLSVPYNGSGGSVTLVALWPGTGTAVPVTWMATTSAVPMVAMGKSANNYADLARNYNCVRNSASQLTLDRPWFATGGTGFFADSGGITGLPITGIGQQPYMLGIKAFYMNLLSQAAAITGDSGLNAAATAYSSATGYTADATQWLKANAIDPNTGGLYYGRVYPFCEPFTVDNNTATGQYRQLGCAFTTGLSNIVPARQLTAEIGNAFGALYSGLPTSGNKTFGDTSYSSIWSHPAYNDPSVSSLDDGLSVAFNINQSNLLDTYIRQGKYYGQVAGMGFLAQWPAVRQGGVQPADTRTIKIPFRLANVANAAEVAITITEPTGVAHSAVVCTTSPCSVSADARQGSHLYKMDYRNSSHAVIAPGELLPLYVR